eukprot:CAMPEP_0181420032 /NCGR_PEP_ID=MMETSP1110-20121109/12376_1 /TAXON_ID=174948 /ORGANISM="Symbiodinium sp., Strain CCMP421" /LENGTH=145 /DNA_ID=CAMNT_0023543059 /DNA_START=37 /DNA_END=474 /DNA_ORIENTATION=+
MPCLRSDWESAADGCAENKLMQTEALRLGRMTGLIRNVGSSAHPEFCSRPCAFFAAGFCSRGSACSMCHASHSETAVKLDKRQRASFQALQRREVLELLTSQLRVKCDAQGSPGLRDCLVPIFRILDDVWVGAIQLVKAFVPEPL